MDLIRTKPKYDYRQVFLDFNRSLYTIQDKTALMSSILTRIYELIPAEPVHLLWENSDTSRYQLVNSDLTPVGRLYLLPGDGLVQWLLTNGQPLILSAAPEYANILSERDARTVQELGCVTACPLKANNRLKGVIFLGNRKDDRPYRQRDTEMLSVLLDNAALAIENITYHDERVNHMKRIMRTDRLAVVGQLAAGAAHEIRNPLTGIRSSIQYIQKDIREPEKQKLMKSALQEVDRINGILTGLLSFSRSADPVKQTFDLVNMLEQTLGLIKNTRIKKQIRFVTEYSAPAINIIADSDQLKQGLMNIILNAIDAIEEEGVVKIEVGRSVMENAEYHAITVSDNGKGIAPEDIEKVFDPFYTTKEDGTGLGMSISYGIIHRHGGNIDIANLPEGGVRVIVRLPVENS